MDAMVVDGQIPAEELQSILCIDEQMAGKLLFPGSPDRMECCLFS